MKLNPNLELQAWQSLHLPWPETGVPPGKAPEVRWQVADGKLIWEMRCPLPLAGQDTFPEGGFVEGLWTNDLAECFLLDVRTGFYTEYNLSPRGAWWAAAFTAPRVRAAPQPDGAHFGVRVETAWDAEGWTGRMEITLLDPAGPLAVNFTGVVITPDGPGYFSLAQLGGLRPDFHRPHEWLAIA